MLNGNGIIFTVFLIKAEETSFRNNNNQKGNAI